MAEKNIEYEADSFYKLYTTIHGQLDYIVVKVVKKCKDSKYEVVNILSHTVLYVEEKDLGR